MLWSDVLLFKSTCFSKQQDEIQITSGQSMFAMSGFVNSCLSDPEVFQKRELWDLINALTVYWYGFTVMVDACVVLPETVKRCTFT